ncbi:MAG: NRDE family protein [Geminicoccaceae bacterium]|nr:NRDE family protein [Geminicoccaceae bacterium]
MCSLIVLRRPTHEHWPVLIAANRDEATSRPWRPPGRHWPERPEVRAGIDEAAGGTWLGINDDGLVAAVLNRRGTLGAQAGKRSRGELVLEALDHADAEAAAGALAHVDPDAYRPFNLIVADPLDAFWIRHAGDGMISAMPLLDGWTMATAGEPNDPTSARTRRYLPLFRRAAVPEPACDARGGDWTDWRLLLASRATESGDPVDAMCIRTDRDYGTVCSSLIALPAEVGAAPLWLFADGPPDTSSFERVD